MKTLKQQNKTLKKHFGLEVQITEPQKHSEYPDTVLIPKWSKIASTYNEALDKVLEAIEKEMPFYNWRKGQTSGKYLKPLERDVPELLCVQMGTKHLGKSVKTVREHKAENEVLLGAYEVGMIILLNDIRTNDIWIDCVGDEYAYGDDDFSRAPCFFFYDGKVWFDTRDVSDALGNYGSASGFFPQNLDTRTLGTFDEPLKLESALKIVVDAGYIVYKKI